MVRDISDQRPRTVGGFLMALDSKSGFLRAVIPEASPRRFTIVSTCPDAWGGSEELWAGAARVLAEKGHRVSAFKTALDASHPGIRRLKSLSCTVDQKS